MKILIFIMVILLSCEGRTQKYIERSNELDGPRCKRFVYFDYNNFEIAQCVESKLYFIAPLRNFRKYETFFHRRVALIYVEDSTNFEILKNENFMFDILEKWKPEDEILSIQLDDSLMVFHSMDSSFLFKDFKYKIK